MVTLRWNANPRAWENTTCHPASLFTVSNTASQRGFGSGQEWLVFSSLASLRVKMTAGRIQHVRGGFLRSLERRLRLVCAPRPFKGAVLWLTHFQHIQQVAG